MTEMNRLIEYMKIHLISLEQDLEVIQSKSDLTGAHYVKKAEIEITKHLLSTARVYQDQNDLMTL